MTKRVRSFFEVISETFDENREEFLDAQTDPNMINYLVGKIMVKSKGEINPELSMKVIKAIVESDLPNTFKMTLKEKSNT